MDKQKFEFELQCNVDQWIDRTFNSIALNVIETMARAENIELFTLIHQEQEQDVFFNEWLTTDDRTELLIEFIPEVWNLNNETVIKAFALLLSEMDYSTLETVPQLSENIDLLNSRIEALHNYDDFVSQRAGENYPMWATIFEFKNEAREFEIEAAKKSGFGVINGFGDFNTMLFVAGCGYSFMGHHWIPMYLKMPFNKKEAKLSEGMRFDHL